MHVPSKSLQHNFLKRFIIQIRIHLNIKLRLYYLTKQHRKICYIPKPSLKSYLSNISSLIKFHAEVLTLLSDRNEIYIRILYSKYFIMPILLKHAVIFTLCLDLLIFMLKVLLTNVWKYLLYFLNDVIFISFLYLFTSYSIYY